MIFIVITEKTIYHEADERSKRWPGHGYPAWTETVQEAKYITTEPAFQNLVSELVKQGKKFRAFTAQELDVVTSINISVKPL